MINMIDGSSPQILTKLGDVEPGRAGSFAAKLACMVAD
jgi:hypothetical protein